MELDPRKKDRWVIGTQPDADLRLPSADSSPPSEAEICFLRGKDMIYSTGEGEVRINRTGVIEDSLPESCFIWFGPHRYRWEKPILTPASPRGYLYLRDLRVQKGKKIILQNLSFGINHDTGMTGIFGPSGCGKSTLIKELLSPSTEGGRNIIRHPQSSLGYIPQEDNLPLYLTVEECLVQSILFREPTLPMRKAKAKASRLAEVLGLSALQKRAFGRLSGGERKRVSVAMELGGEPDILFLDEPVTGLDPQSQKVVMDHLKQISKDREITIICVTHALETIADFDQIVILQPLNETPTKEESSLCYAGPRHTDTIDEVCRLYNLEQFNEIFRHSKRRPPPTNKTPSGERFLSVKKPPPTSQFLCGWELFDKKNYRPWGKQILLIAWRSLLQVSRNHASLAVTLSLPIIIGLLIFLAEGRADVDDIWGFRPGLFLYSGITGLWLGMTLVIRNVVSERSICERDMRTGLYPHCYGLGKVLFLLGGGLLQTLLLTATLWGLHFLAPFGLVLRLPWSDLMMVFPFTLALFLMVLGGGFLGLAVSAWTRKEYVAVSILPLLMIPHLLFNMSAYNPGGRYNPETPYNPVFLSPEEEDLDPTFYARIHATVSLPLLSRPFLNVMEGRAAAIQAQKGETDINAIEHPSQRFISEKHQQAFRAEWLYFFVLLGFHGFLTAGCMYCFLPRRTANTKRP